MWRVVDDFVMSMPQQFVDAKLKFTEAVTGAHKHERWSYCIEKMMTPMDMTLGRLFVDAHFDEATKQTVNDLLRFEDWCIYSKYLSAHDT